MLLGAAMLGMAAGEEGGLEAVVARLQAAPQVVVVVEVVGVVD